VKRVLIIGAHPDDEDTSLLALLVRGLGADAAYLSLNRGEGGQNLIGPELGVGLGLVRTEELLAARRLDGAEQFFSRAYDFGYSKFAEETFNFWPRDSLLADVVDVVRRFRPQIIVSTFSGTPRDGHGQHQVAGILAREAFDVAGDPGRFPDQLAEGLEPWTPLKLYRSTRFDRDATTLTVETGRLDPLFGRSYHQIAMSSRSQHRSQDMGRIESLGPRSTNLQLLENRVAIVSAGRDTALFDGVDTTLVGLLAEVPEGSARNALEESLHTYVGRLGRAKHLLGNGSLGSVVPELSDALTSLRSVLELADAAGPRAGELRFALEQDEHRLGIALSEAAGVIIEAFSDDDLLVPGQQVEVEVQVWNGGDHTVGLDELVLSTPTGWTIAPSGWQNVELLPGTLTSHRFALAVPEFAEFTKPYFLRAPLVSGIYQWPTDRSVRTKPFDAPFVETHAVLSIAGTSVERVAAAVYRFADQAIGEIRRPLYVVPAVGVEIVPRTAVWPFGEEKGVTFSVGLTGEAPSGVEGIAFLEVPSGWTVSPSQVPFELSAPGRATTVDFRVMPELLKEPGRFEVRAVAETTDGRRFDVGYSVIDYPHTQRRLLFEDAAARVEATDLAVEPNLHVGYVPGAGDEVAEAIAALGVSVDILDDQAVAAGDLEAYDAIVVGIRAYEANPALVASNERLLKWVQGGGTLIVQYQQYSYFSGDHAAYPLSARQPHDRVTVESAPVTILTPEHPVFSHPNSIVPSDFDGWVQERGLYFASEWDDRYEALLETSDPGETAKRGGLLVARYGDGLYVYTGLSLFRQLPVGVPGAYRLLANLLSLRG
jgi:LmbE family N-acetylglucosaminyl deacetylase